MIELIELSIVNPKMYLWRYCIICAGDCKETYQCCTTRSSEEKGDEILRPEKDWTRGEETFSWWYHCYCLVSWLQPDQSELHSRTIAFNHSRGRHLCKWQRLVVGGSTYLLLQPCSIYICPYFLPLKQERKMFLCIAVLLKLQKASSTILWWSAWRAEWIIKQLNTLKKIM